MQDWNLEKKKEHASSLRRLCTVYAPVLKGFTHLADTLRSYGFKPTRYENDVCIRLDDSKQHYEYICTHVDDFMICSKNPERIMEELSSVYKVKESSKGEPSIRKIDGGVLVVKE